MSSFGFVLGLIPCRPVDLVSILVSFKPSNIVRSFATHIHDLHADIRHKLPLRSNNYLYC